MIKAIIIDDEMHCRKTLGILLKEYCPDVQVIEQCDNGEAGVEAIKKGKPDLVFLDIEMPRMNGLEVLEHRPRRIKKSDTESQSAVTPSAGTTAGNSIAKIKSSTFCY